MTVVLFKHPTRYGDCEIRWRNDTQRWHVLLGGEDLGNYHTAMAAHDDVVGGHCFSHSTCADTSQIGLPQDLAEWQAFRV
jgi:hypothetical protein